MRLSGFHLPVSHLSATALADAIVCPEQFRQRRLLRRPEKQHVDRFIGAVHHATVEENFRQKMETGNDQTLDQQAGVYTYKWHEVLDRDGEPEWKSPPEEVRELGLKMIVAFHTEVANRIVPSAVEEWFEERVPGLPVPIVGRVDVREDGVTHEFKTAKQKPSSNKPKPKWRFQARTYQLFVRNPVVWTVTTKQAAPRIYSGLDYETLVQPVGSPDPAVRLLQQTVEYINDLYARYGANEPWPTHGLMSEWQCSYCPFGPKNPAPTCPAWM